MLFKRTTIAPQERGLRYVNGALTEILAPGVYWTSRLFGRVVIEVRNINDPAFDFEYVDILLETAPTLASQNFVMADINDTEVGLVYYNDRLSRVLAPGTRQLFWREPKMVAVEVIRSGVLEPLAAVGIVVKNVGIKDIILPGEMKDILNQVVLAEKTAQANNIRRREETAATRSLLNTAKLMEENPLLIRLKELETLEKVTDRVERLTVFGGLDGVLKDMVTINP